MDLGKSDILQRDVYLTAQTFAGHEIMGRAWQIIR